jgi:ribosomal protein S18 acetylase RimI-like enzyme
MKIRKTIIEDLPAILDLYKHVSAMPGGLARLKEEIDSDYVTSFITKTISNGVGYVAFNEGDKLVGEIHAYTPGLYCFSHVLSDLTIAVDPDSQGAGVGRQIFEKFMNSILNDRKDISRIELVARESNQIAIKFYESLGFIIEGRFSSRIKNVDGSFEADIPMAWSRA